MSRADRDSIFVEQATLLERRLYDGEQFILRLQAPATARHARPGSFVHLTCDRALPMRRPLSLMRVDAEQGWIEVLFKIVGAGLRALADQPCGTELSVMGPIGKPFALHAKRPHTLLIGGGVGIPPMIFLAETIAADRNTGWQPIMFMGSEIPFPFTTTRSTFTVDGMPEDASHGLKLVEDWQIPSRLASLAGLDGAHRGYVTDLATSWLQQQPEPVLEKTEILACGPTPMLRAVADVAARFGVACQVSLEEYMACAVGGCAGCAVAVTAPDGSCAMKRVCVDGPVFDSRAVFPSA